MSEGQSGFFALGIIGVFALGTDGGLGFCGSNTGGGGGSCFISIFES